MRNLPPMNEYQQLLYSALALVDEADLVAILRVAGQHPLRNSCIDRVNEDLDKGLPLWDSFAEGSSLYALFENDCMEFRVRIHTDQRSIDLDLGINSRPSDILCWTARMGPTGVVEKLEEPERYWPEGIPPERQLGY
ncbi:MAG: hypothetical protein ABIY71_00350, partial [Flavobacteriales bacterium]